MENLVVGLEVGEPGADDPVVATTDGDFEAFCRDAYPTMVRLAFLLTGSADTAEDLVQDALARTYPKWSKVTEPTAYVRRAVVNACHSHHRRRFLERAHPQRAPEPTTLAADELFDVLAALPARMRTAIVLRYYQDLAEPDIAEILGCAPATVRSLIHRGLARLRTVIEP